MDDEDPIKWVDYMEAVFAKYKLRPKTILDLACGSGSVSVECAKRGYEVIGIDISSDMLSIAKDKALKEQQDILFLNQDATEFELYGTVDAVICFLDGVNYITNPKKLQKMFELVYNYLNPNGLFIFDVRSQYAFCELGGNNTFFNELDNVSYVIQNSFDNKSKICNMDVTFFVREGGLYRRFNENHILRLYDVDTVSSYLNNKKMCFLGAYDKLSFNKIKRDTERVMVISKKV